MNAQLYTAADKRGRLDHIDGLRALAAIYVVVHHCFLYVGRDVPGGMGLRVFLYGHYAVDMFIVLSGFCLMLPVLKNGGDIRGGSWSFYRSRARRILPPYYAALAVSLLLIWFCIGSRRGTLWDQCVPVTGAGILTHLLVIQDMFTSFRHQINHSFWSISVEWRIYFMFPVIIYCWKRFGALRTVATVTMVSYLLLIPLAWTPVDDSTTGVCLHYYGLFSFGMLAAAVTRSGDAALLRWRDRLPWGTLFIGMWAVALTCNKASFHGLRAPWQLEDLFIGLGTLCLLVALAPGKSGDRWRWLRGAFSWTPLVFVGTFSYSLYLLHAPLLEVLWAYWVQPLKTSGPVSFLLLSTVGLAAMIGISYLFYLIFERPFTGSGKRREKKPEPLPEPMGSEGAILTP